MVFVRREVKCIRVRRYLPPIPDARSTVLLLISSHLIPLSPSHSQTPIPSHIKSPKARKRTSSDTQSINQRSSQAESKSSNTGFIWKRDCHCVVSKFNPATCPLLLRASRSGDELECRKMAGFAWLRWVPFV